MLEKFLKYCAHPLAGLATGVFSQVGELRRLQWAAKEELERRLMKRLRYLLEHSYRNVTLYRRKLEHAGLSPDDIRSLDDFRKIPITTKAEVSEYIQTERILEGGNGRTTRTGGTTGIPLVFLTDRNAGISGLASKVFFDSWMGCSPYDRKFLIRSEVSLKDRMFLNEPGLPFFSVLKEPRKALRKIKLFRPLLLTGGSVLRMLASYAGRNGLPPNGRPKAVAAFGIPLLPEHKQMLSDAFGEFIHDRYGSAELGGPAALQCNVREGLHMNTELALIEVVKDGEASGEGERGRLIITNLRNLATPFIRYYQEDTAIPLTDCACGRSLPLIANIQGKDPSTIEVKDGIQIPRSALHAVVGRLEELRYIRKFAFRKGSGNNLSLEIVPADGFESSMVERIERRLQAKLAPLVEISVEAKAQ